LTFRSWPMLLAHSAQKSLIVPSSGPRLMICAAIARVRFFTTKNENADQSLSNFARAQCLPDYRPEGPERICCQGNLRLQAGIDPASRLPRHGSSSKRSARSSQNRGPFRGPVSSSAWTKLRGQGRGSS